MRIAGRAGAPDPNRILEVSLSLAESLDLGTVLTHAITVAVESLGADTGAVYLVDGDDLVLGATVPPMDIGSAPPAALRSPLALSPQIAKSLDSLAPHALYRHEATRLELHEREIMELRNIASLLFVPIVHDGRALGVLMVGNSDPSREYDDDDTYLARALSAEVGLAVTNARLYLQAEQTAQEMADIAGFSEAVLGASPVGILVIDGKGAITLVNDAAAHVLGASRELLLATNVTSLDNWHRIGLIDLIRRAASEHKQLTFEYTGPTSWGRDVSVEITLTPFARSSEDHVLLMVSDVSARRNAEAALRESEEHFRLLADNSADVIWILDIDEFRLSYVTPSVERLLGYTPAEIQAMDLAELLVPESLRLVVAMLSTAVDTYHSGDTVAVRTVELDMTRSDGSTVTTETVTRFLPSDDGAPHAILGTIRDVTERKLAEGALHRRAEFDAMFSDIMVELAGYDTDHVDEAVVHALERVARFLNVDGAFVFGISANGQAGSISHAWRQPEAPLEMEEVRDVPLDALESISTTLIRNGVIAVSSVEDFPVEATADRAFHQLLGAESALEVPMKGKHGVVVGAVGLVACRAGVVWTDEEVRLARLLGSAIANSLERQAAEIAQRATANDWIQTFEAADDGIAVVEPGAKIRQLNAAMARRFGRPVGDCIGEYCTFLRGCAEDLVGACPHAEVLASGRPQTAELFDVSTGQTYLVTSSPLRDSSGAVTGTVCISHDITEIKSYDAQMRQLAEEVSLSQLATIFALAKLAESRDDATGQHIECVQELCRVLAYEMREMPEFQQHIDDAFVSRLAAASPLHDVGKVGVPDSILLKPGRLTPEEFDTVKTHTTIGANTLEAVRVQHPNNEFVGMGVDIARSHHERWDGAGYPDGLAGEDIPLAARIMTVADVYEALRSSRVYKDAYSHEESVRLIVEERGTKYDPNVVDAFLRCVDKFELAWGSLRER